jgi:hypothetical protein
MSTQPSDAPWLARKDWAADTLRDNVALRPEIYILAFVGPVFLAIAVGGTYSIVNDWLHGRPPNDPGVVLVALFCGLAGFGLTFRSVQLIWRWLVHGGSRLKLASVPIPLGGALRAELVTARRIPAGCAVRATLKCMSATVSHPISINRTYSTREDWSISHHVVWQDEDMITSDGSGHLPIAFAVPADQPETTPRNDVGWRYWTLEIADPGGQRQAFRAEFVLPVFAAPLGTAGAVDAAAILAARQHKQTDFQPSPKTRVHIAMAGEGGTAFALPPVGIAGGAIAQSIVLLVSVGLMLAARYYQLTLLIVAPWGVLNFLLLVWVVRLWTAPERIVIGNGAVRMTSGLFGITRTLPLSEVTAIHAVRITSPFLVSVRIRGKAWHTIGVGQGIRESREAEWLALQMSRTAGIAPAGPAPVNESAEQMEVIAALAKELNSAEGRTRLGKFRTVIARAAREDRQDR